MIRALLALVLVLAGAPAAGAITGTTSLHYTRTPSNKIDTRYHDGNDGTSAIPLKWATITPISVLTTDSGSQNICQPYLTQPAAPGDIADITVSAGFALPTGFTLGSAHNCVLSWTTPSAGTFSLSLTATLAGVIPAVSIPFAITVTTPPSTDLTAPTIPTGIVITNGVGSFTVSGDASSDPFDSTQGSGVATYEICLGGGGCRTTPAVASIQPQLTFLTVGSPTPAPTCIQSGADWQCTAAGTADGTTDALGFLSTSVTGDFCATEKITSIASAADYGKGEILVRETTAANSRKFESVIARLIAGGGTYFWNVSHRVADGNSRSSVTTVNPVASPTWHQVCRTGSTFTGSYSTNSNTWLSTATDATVGFGSTVLVGPATVGTGTVATVNHAQWNITSAPRWSYTYTTSVGGAVTVRANDVAGNHSAFNSAGTAAPTSPADTTPPTRTVQPVNPTTGVTSTSITWDLGTCTDASGVRGYVPFTKTTNGGTRTTQAEQAVNSYTQTGLSPSTTYYLDAKCVDNANNTESSFSTQVSATTSASSTDPASAPTISSFGQNTDRSASYTLTHSLVANAHHYNVQMADCPNGITPGSYSTVNTHTTATVNLTGFTVSATANDVKSVKVQAANATNSVVFTSAATPCVYLFEPYSGLIDMARGHFVEIYATAERPTRETTSALAYFDLGPEWAGIMRAQLQLGAFEGPATGNATSHSQANPVTGAGYERGQSIMNWYSSHATAKGKKFIMMLSDKVHGSYGAISPDLFPAYFKTDPQYANSADPAGNGGYFVSETGTQGTSGWAIYGRVWDPKIALIYADAAEWACRHYNSDPAFAGLQLTSVSVAPGSFETSGTTAHSGYNWAGYIAGVKVILARARQYCTNKEVSIRFDWPATYTDALSFWKWARAWRITGTNFDTTDWAGRTEGSVSVGSIATGGEGWGTSAFRGRPNVNGQPAPGGAQAGTGGPDLKNKTAWLAPSQPLDWVRALQYGLVSIDEILDLFNVAGARSGYWTPDTSSCGPNSGFTPSNLGPTAGTSTNCPGSGTLIWDVMRQCMAASVDQPAIGCTISRRNAALSTACPTDWIGCSP